MTSGRYPSPIEKLIHSNRVTMPLKAAILPYLDEISPESRATGACNTIIKVPTATGFKFVGQNTDS